MVNIVLDNGILEIENLKISIKKQNNGYNFGKFVLDRTQTISVPKTPKNMQLLDLGDFHYYGTNERRYYNAQLVGEGIAENGTLYIDKIEEDEFRCVFVFSQFQALKELSTEKIATRLEPYDQKIIVGATTPANAENIDLVAGVYYYNNDMLDKTYPSQATIMPSIGVKKLLDIANAVYSQQVSIDVVDDYRIIIAGKLKDATREEVVFAKNGINAVSPSQNLKKIITTYVDYNVANVTGNRGSRSEQAMLVYNLDGCTLQFPDDFPDDVFLVADYTHYEPWDGFVKVDLEFFGSYSFDWEQRIIGTSISEEGERSTIGLPLAGKSVEIPYIKSRTYTNSSNTSQVVVIPRVSFFKKTDFHNTKSDVSDNAYRYAGFLTGDASPFNFNFAEVKKNVNTNNYYKNVTSAYLLDNLPDISFLQLYSTIAFLHDKIVVRDSNNRLTMQSYDNYEEVTLSNIISIGTVERVGLAEAQKNIIEFEETSTTAENDRIKDIYYTDNDIYKEEEILFTLPFSEGKDLQGNLFINDIKDLSAQEELPKWTKYELVGDTFTIAKNNGGIFLQRVASPYNDLLRRIMYHSTRINVTVYMSLYEYNKIKETTRLIVQGTMCIWTSSTWNDNKAKFVLQKI
ncbi:MAG: hypothetical protein U0O22_04505 [Acutalibacteraceae bacterium]